MLFLFSISIYTKIDLRLSIIAKQNILNLSLNFLFRSETWHFTFVWLSHAVHLIKLQSYHRISGGNQISIWKFLKILSFLFRKYQNTGKYREKMHKNCSRLKTWKIQVSFVFPRADWEGCSFCEDKIRQNKYFIIYQCTRGHTSD